MVRNSHSLWYDDERREGGVTAAVAGAAERMTGPPGLRLLASLAIGLLLAGAYWWLMDQIIAAMLAEAR